LICVLGRRPPAWQGGVRLTASGLVAGGRSVFMNRLEGGEDTATRLVEHSPQLPQGFTPIGDLAIWPGAPWRRK